MLLAPFRKYLTKPKKQGDETLKAGQKGRGFYLFAFSLFCFLTVTGIITCLWAGFSDERVTLILLNSWFTIYTGEILRRSKRKKYPASEELLPEDGEKSDVITPNTAAKEEKRNKTETSGREAA